MSQAGIINTTTGPVPPVVATSYVTDVNSPAIPVANILNVLGNDTTVNNNNGIRTDGSSGSNTLTVQLTNRLQGTGTTVGASTTTLVTFPLGATPASYNVEAKFVGFESTTPASTGYTVIGTVRTTGAAGALDGVPDETPIEHVALITSDVNFVISGNDLLLQVVGVAGLTISWNVVATYTFIS